MEDTDHASRARQGDSIAVGRQEKGLLKLPLVVRGI